MAGIFFRFGVEEGGGIKLLSISGVDFGVFSDVLGVEDCFGGVGSGGAGGVAGCAGGLAGCAGGGAG